MYPQKNAIKLTADDCICAEVGGLFFIASNCGIISKVCSIKSDISARGSNMLQMRAMDDESMEKVRRLYEGSFPANERKPLEELLDRRLSERDFVVFYDGDVFCGFASLLTWNDLTHILYFAIDDALRGKGYGSEALLKIETLRKNNRFIADLEADVPSAKNKEERLMRSRFYQKNGYTKSGISYQWRGEEYEIFAKGGSVSEEEFWNFWKYFRHVFDRLASETEKSL